MWAEWSLIRAVHWVDGHGWWAVGVGSNYHEGYDDFFQEEYSYYTDDGLVVRSVTGASGWSGNLLELVIPAPLDPETEEPIGDPTVERGSPQLGVAHVGNTLVTVGTDGSYAWDVTDDSFAPGSEGMTPWDPEEPNTRFMWGGGVAYGSGRFVATDTFALDGDSPQTIHTTVDGVNWANVGYTSPAMPGDYWGDWGAEWRTPGFPVCFASGQFVAVTSYGWIIRSSDGLNWETVRSPKAHQRVLRGVAEKNGVFVAVGDGGTILRSTNGTTWRRCEVPLVADLFAVAAGAHWFLAAGRNETVLISTDGETWQSITVPSGADPKANYTAAGFGDGHFLLATSTGQSLLSGEEPLPVGIAVTPAGAGVASVTDRGVLAVAEGDTLNVTAQAMPGYRFVGWTGSVEQAAAELSATVTAPLALTAHFARVTSLRVDFQEGPPLSEPRMGHRALLLDGTPVLVGGHTTGFTRSGTLDRGLMEPGTNELLSFALADVPATADAAAVAQLADGQTLIAGGAMDDLGIAPGIATALLVGPDGAGGVTVSEVAATMVRPRMAAAAARLANGKVLIAGGWWDLGSATYGELFTPAVVRAEASFAETGPLSVPRSSPLVLPTNDGGAVVAGGIRPSFDPAFAVEYYSPGTNTFAVISDSLLGDGEPWILNTQIPGDIGSQRLADGTYVLWAWHQTTHEGTIVRFHPATRFFERLPLTPALTGVGNQAFMPVLDDSGTLAFILTASYDDIRPESQFHVHVVELASGRRVTTTVPFTVAGYYPAGATLSGFEVDGTTRLLLAGGSSTTDITQNFHPVARSFLFDPMLTMLQGEPTTVAMDYRGFLEVADNVRMARATDGALHLTYARAMRASGSPGWYSLVRTRDAAGDWQPEVRTENFPDSNHADSIVVDSTGLLHQGFTFNVGSFHTTSANGGATWTYPTALRDGGWGFWDWDSRLARHGDQLFAVFSSCYGWQDYPANIMLREWHADTGWGTPVWLTSLPNEDASANGVSGSRFQIRPDGYGVVLYTESTAAAPAQVKLLEVSLPYGSTVALAVSNPARWAKGGDVAVDSDGVAHLVWLEADAAGGVYELWYRTYHTITGLSAPLRLSSALEASVRTATVGAYPGGRVLAAYGLAGNGTEYGGVFARKIADVVSAPVLIGRTTSAHSPGLRSTWDMVQPNLIDLTWVEAYTWGSQLLHREFAWEDLGAVATSAVTIRSNQATATFTLSGPVSGTFALVNGEWVIPALPPGLYTITWDAVPGQATPPPLTFVVTGDGEIVLGTSYIDENLHRVTLAASPSGTGSITSAPVGTGLLAGDRAYGDGSVTFQARPIEGYGFVRWRLTNNLGTGYWDQNPLTVTIDRDFEVQAEFQVAGPYRVDTALFGGGTITPGATVPGGGRFVCTIAPAAGEQLAEVLVNGVPQGLATEVVVDPVTEPSSIQAFTEPASAEVNAVWLPEEGGTVTVTPATFVLGQTVTVEAEPNDGYVFVEWRGDASGTNATISLLVDRAKNLTAIFAPDDLILGDLNVDGAISIEDAVVARRMYAGLESTDLARADMNGDHYLGTADIAAVLQAAARGDRLCLGGQEVAPSASKRVVAFPNGIGLTLPGGWPSTSLRASVALASPDELPDLPPGLEAVGSIYDIRFAGTEDFGREIGFEIPYDGAATRGAADLTKMVLLFNEETNSWVKVPSSILTKAYNAGEKAGKYVVAKLRGNLIPVPGTHCVVYYDPGVSYQLGGAMSGSAFATQIAAKFDLVYEAYVSTLNYDVPAYEKSSVNLFLTSVDLDRRADIFLSDASNTYKEAFYSWKTKKYYLPASFNSADEVQATLAHEMFHAIQNLKFTGPAMAVNRWLFEMTAEYASRKAPYDTPLSTGYMVELDAPLGSLNDIHEYACAHLLKYLLDEGGGTFSDLWKNHLATSFTPRAALETYTKETVSRSLNRVYADFLEDILFDSAVADLASLDMTAWGTGNVIDKAVAIPGAEAAGWVKTKVLVSASYPARVLVELPEDIPAHVNARIYAAPTVDPKTPGGRNPLGSFFPGETLPFAPAELGNRDSVYVTAYNYFGSGPKSLRVRIRPLVVTLDQAPTAAVSGTPCTFTATVAPIPDCARQLKVYWKLSDGTPWQIETVPVDTPKFELKHSFQCEKDKTFQVTFELHCLDADGRRRLLVSQTQDVAVDARPTILLAPSVVQAEIGQSIAFTAQVANGPDVPQFQWTFGDGSPMEPTDVGGASHSYAVAGDYSVTVALADVAAPTAILAQCNGRVVIVDPVQDIDPPVDPPPAAPALDYSKLTRVDETRWWDDVREVYFLDGAGRKHGLYQSFIQSGSSSRPLEAGMYIHDRQEGQWLIYWQDGSGTIEKRHFHWNQWVGTGTQARAVTAMVRVGSGSPVHVYFDDAGVTATNWPSAVSGSSCVIHYADGSTETVAFDGQGRREGACTMTDGGGNPLMSGSFSAGVKTGVWSYYLGGGAGVSYNHGQDPPNQKK